MRCVPPTSSVHFRPLGAITCVMHKADEGPCRIPLGINNLHEQKADFTCVAGTVCLETHTAFARDSRFGTLDSIKPNARLPPSGVTACGVLWVEPGDPMTRRPSSIVSLFNCYDRAITVTVVTVRRDCHHPETGFRVVRSVKIVLSFCIRRAFPTLNPEGSIDCGACVPA